MAEEDCPECAFMIPLVRNSDRQLHGPIAWRDFEDTILRTFVEGSTGPERLFRVAAPVPGLWRDGAQKTVEDENWRYYLAIPRGRIDELRAVLKRACNTFDQEAIYLSVGGSAGLVRGKPEDGFLGGGP